MTGGFCLACSLKPGDTKCKKHRYGVYTGGGGSYYAPPQPQSYHMNPKPYKSHYSLPAPPHSAPPYASYNQGARRAPPPNLMPMIQEPTSQTGFYFSPQRGSYSAPGSPTGRRVAFGPDTSKRGSWWGS